MPIFCFFPIFFIRKRNAPYVLPFQYSFAEIPYRVLTFQCIFQDNKSLPANFRSPFFWILVKGTWKINYFISPARKSYIIIEILETNREVRKNSFSWDFYLILLGILCFILKPFLNYSQSFYVQFSSSSQITCFQISLLKSKRNYFRSN